LFNTKKIRGGNMKIAMDRFKYKPKELDCCPECKNKVCNVNPVKCIDFFIANKKVFDEIRSEINEEN
jgi:hypothetical protein